MQEQNFVDLEVKRDSLAMELLSELKTQTKRWFTAFIVTVCIALGVIGGIVGGFIWYLNQYDYVSSIEQNGIYTLIDSEGNVISADITPEQMKEILEIINNGKNESNSQTD